ncbi:hypothetical protein PPERSA_08055 [Pseudocohnilembus persalinus]|uniref:Uncharacterized protein n=1 Tax=Pseudocohnilembus persalinus TaxID=266149 RepID=A0A0V0R3G3_PSEPJ|nr:hypothetical protein PPERSA_08055 [Pseudocohnilembus persalinus]|eukprot:KRX08744.1 hypothetical protein PPERSA_08055 [Pseudocohnilembus persalinus]
MQLNPTIRSFNTFQNKFPLGVLEFNKYNKNLPNSELKIGDFSKIQEKVQNNGFSHAMDLVHNDFAMDEFQLSEVETIMSLQDGNESTISLDFESESEFFDSPNSSYCYNSSKTSMI